jgi:transposase
VLLGAMGLLWPWPAELRRSFAINGDISKLKFEASKNHYRKNELRFNPIPYLKAILGVDTSQIFGYSDETCLTIFAEVGSDLTCFGTPNRFASWIGIAPNNKISGGKIISSHIPKKKHPLKTILIQAANSLYRSNNPFGDCYRRLKSRLGPKAAKCAMARKMAIVYYLMVTRKQEFDSRLFEENQAKFKQKRIKYLETQLAELKKIA